VFKFFPANFILSNFFLNYYDIMLLEAKMKFYVLRMAAKAHNCILSYEFNKALYCHMRVFKARRA
jgi:hypothetical protein